MRATEAGREYEAIWFRVPDQETQVDCHATALHADQGGRRCAEDLTARDNTALLTALRELITAGNCTTSVDTRIDTLLRADGRKGGVRPPVQGATCDRSGQRWSARPRQRPHASAAHAVARNPQGDAGALPG
ncbi:hypothetical protein [Streptomyces sp. NPDC058155]|uniref:hypothetical protein n=1 Tax=Streptomyces sp. NPDC058155 TaxID=3346359 RepID=UPI0036E94314